MEPITIAALTATALGGGYIAWKELHKMPAGVTSPPPPSGWAAPPTAPGYTAPPAPKNIPPSWTYQGPPVAAAPATGAQQAITLAPGTMQLTATPGTVLTIKLPAGAKWGTNTDPNASVNIPTSIGGDLSGGGDTGDGTPLVITGLSGSGTAQMGWYDAAGKVQSTMLDVQAGAPTGFMTGGAGYEEEVGAAGGERIVDLDSSMSDADQQAVIGAIMSQTSAVALTGLAVKYQAHPYARYELLLRAWELGGKKGKAPTPPNGGGAMAPTHQTHATKGTKKASPASMAAQAVSVAIQAGKAAQHTGAQPGYSSYRGNNGFVGVTDPGAREEVQGTPQNAQGFEEGVGSNTLIPNDGHEEVAGTPQNANGYEEEVGGSAERDGRAEGVSGTPQNAQGFEEGVGAQPGRYDHARGSEREITGATPAAVIQAASAVPTTVGTGVRRPVGGWYIRVKDGDKAWPRSIASIGSGAPRGGSAASLQHLVNINPHLSPGGVIRQIVSGDEVNVPGAWANNLTARGFDVRADRDSVGEMG